jgi:hypothetical protein
MLNENDLTKLHFYLNVASSEIYSENVTRGWYTDIATGEPKVRNIPEMLCLIHSEISEGLEGYRKSALDTHLVERPMLEVELADALIRIFDLAGYQGLDLGGAFVEKLIYNRSRADHILENRKLEGGKSC